MCRSIVLRVYVILGLLLIVLLLLLLLRWIELMVHKRLLLLLNRWLLSTTYDQHVI